MFFVYVLESENSGKYYIGQTNNLESRLDSHNRGYNRYTKPYRPWKLILCKSYTSRSESMKVEKKLKSLKKRELVIKFAIENSFLELKIGM